MESLEECSKVDATPVAYVEFKNLPNIFEGKTISAVEENLKGLLKDKNDWRAQFSFLDGLRSFNKWFGTEGLNQVLTGIVISSVKDCMDSIRSNIAKNALMLCAEIFGAVATVPLSEEISGSLIAKLLDKSISEKGFIKTEAKTGLKAVEQMFSRPAGGFEAAGSGSLVHFCRALSHKNALLTENAAASLSAAIKDNLKADFVSKLPKETQTIVLKSIARLVEENRRANLTKSGEAVLVFLQGVVGVENFESYLLEVVGSEDTKVIVTFLTTRARGKTSSGEGLQAFINSKKKMMTESLPATNMS